jgi:hypothetical protein
MSLYIPYFTLCKIKSAFDVSCFFFFWTNLEYKELEACYVFYQVNNLKLKKGVGSLDTFQED